MNHSTAKFHPWFGAGGSRRSSRRAGQILVLTLLGLAVLVGLVFYVYNLGWAVNRRLEMQNAADAVAVSGAGWMARSMNMVAMNNCAQSRLLALVAVLDAIPLAAEMAVAEETGEESLRGGLKEQIRRGVPDSRIERGADGSGVLTNFLRNGLEKLLWEMSPQGGGGSQYDALVALDEALDSEDEREPEGGGAFRMREATYWRLDDRGEDPPHGSLWRAVVTLDELSQATVSSAGVLAQANAVEYGRANGADLALLVPVAPSIPYRRGRFRDFEPVLIDHLLVTNDRARKVSSTLVTRLARSSDVDREVERTHVKGGAIPDWAYPHRLGPWARLFRWRVPWTRSSGGSRYGAPDDEIPPRWEGQIRETMGYTTHGPFCWALNLLVNGLGAYWYREGPSDTSRFAFHIVRVATIKLAYMFGLPAPQRIQYTRRWITDYDEAVRFAADPKNQGKILATRYYRPVVLSSVSWDDPNWLVDPDTYWAHRDELTPLSDPKSALWVWEPRGWYDVPRRKRGCEKLNDHIWRRKRQYKVTYDPRVNLFPRFDPETGAPVLWDVYYVSWYVFGGIEIRDEVEIANPCNFDDEDALPGPILLDTREGDYDPERVDPDQGYRRDLFTYLGVVRRKDRDAVWEQKFSNANPDGSTVAVAQVRVFNNKSWDLWTQDWRAQLVPVSRWDDWVEKLQLGIEDVAATEGTLNEQDVETIYRYISGIAPDLVELYLRH